MSIVVSLLVKVRAMAAPDYQARAAAAIRALQRWYRPRTGLWKSTGWWNAANALTAVIGYARHTGDDRHAQVVATTFRQRPAPAPRLREYVLRR